MAWFEKEFVAFFLELEVNNYKEWFHENKKRYEQYVREPFNNFVAEMISRIEKDDPSITLEPKDAVFRINRDIRFSKDKRPYKNHVSAVISRGGRKNLEVPGCYIEFKAEGIQYYGGAYHIEKEPLERVRHLISSDPGAFTKIIKDKKFVDTFGEVLGEKNKRLPKEFEKAAEDQPLLFNKSFYFGTKRDLPLLFSDDLPDEIFKLYLAGKPFNNFFKQVMY
jgi:uncharacterized protein (TIGR02453 family)